MNATGQTQPGEYQVRPDTKLTSIILGTYQLQVSLHGRNCMHFTAGLLQTQTERCVCMATGTPSFISCSCY
jgi:hypothetical protein